MIVSAILYGMTGVLKEEERAAIVEGLERTAGAFASAAQQVPEENWDVARAAGKWSPAQIAEHLVLVEQQLKQMIQEKLLTSPETERSADQEKLDKRVPEAVLNPNRRPEAPPSMRPTGRWSSREETLHAFADERRRTVEYVRTTQDPLRSHRVPHSLGNLDGHHWLLLLVAHTERHTRQLEGAEF